MASAIARLRDFLRELKHRKVFQVGSIYLVTAWGASLGAAELLPAFGAPDWSVRLFVIFAVLGFPIAVVMAWAFELTPEGVVRDARDLPIGGHSEQPTTALFGMHGVVRISWRDARGPHEQRFDKPFCIGRDPSCAIRFDDPVVSRRHAEVSYAGGHWWLADLGSRNGTLLEGAAVTRVALPTQGVIRLSEAGPELEFEIRQPATTTTVLAKS